MIGLILSVKTMRAGRRVYVITIQTMMAMPAIEPNWLKPLKSDRVNVKNAAAVVDAAARVGRHVPLNVALRDFSTSPWRFFSSRYREYT